MEGNAVPSSTLTARVAGVLFIFASAAAIAGGSLLLPISEPGFLGAGGSRAPLVTGALLEFALAVSVAAIAAVLWPMLRRGSEPLAMLYVTTRTLEGVLIAAGATSALVMTSLAGSPAAASAGAAVLEAREWTYRIGTLVVFGASAVVLNAVLVRGREVPRWISWWGLIGGALLLARGIAESYGTGLPAAAQAFLAAPIGVEEMVFAAWLVWKGGARAGT
ncbi:DUF4386 domain-containing protein [Dactylosporangium salmoneum]|uniref:DUF4386 domain-containing protein n=1 Tax=Dactylosporangium salmoneum TaxID=53361 RepID=A0ABP5V9G5_9ACTN